MDLDAFILIGGGSSRLGTDKAFVEFGGRTFAARSADLVKRSLLLNRVTYVARDENQFKTDLLSALRDPVISDVKPGFGAWSGIETALAHARSEWLFILACDLPFVSTEFLQLLAGFMNDDTEAVVARQADGRLQPLCAFYRVRPARSAFEDIFADGCRLPPLTAIFDRLRTRIVDHSEYQGLENAGKFFLNINTAADLAAVS